MFLCWHNRDWLTGFSCFFWIRCISVTLLRVTTSERLWSLWIPAFIRFFQQSIFYIWFEAFYDSTLCSRSTASWALLNKKLIIYLKSTTYHFIFTKFSVRYLCPFRVMPLGSAVRNVIQFTFLNSDWFRRILHIIWIQAQRIAHNLIIFNAKNRARAHQIETIAKAITPWANEPISNVATCSFRTWSGDIWCQTNVTSIIFGGTIAKYWTILCPFAAFCATLFTPIGGDPSTRFATFQHMSTFTNGWVTNQRNWLRVMMIMMMTLFLCLVCMTIISHLLFRAIALLTCVWSLFQAGNFIYVNDNTRT